MEDLTLTGKRSRNSLVEIQLLYIGLEVSAGIKLISFSPKLSSLSRQALVLLMSDSLRWNSMLTRGIA